MKAYDDPLEVQLQQEAPARFWWRGREWAVAEVLASWVTRPPWWEGAAPDGEDRDVWRVEARRGRATGVFDVAFDWATGRWTMLRVHD